MITNEQHSKASEDRQHRDPRYPAGSVLAGWLVVLLALLAGFLLLGPQRVLVAPGS
jgi:hypothetical protein